MKRTWVEVTCDCRGCYGTACHYPPGSVDASARKDGWIITRDGRHYCSPACYGAAKAKREAVSTKPMG